MLQDRKGAISMIGVLVLGLLGGLGWGAVLQGDQDVLVLTGGTLIDGLGNPPLPGAVVMIRGDSIEAINPTSVPAGARKVDITGKFVIPGLIDSHVHWQPWMGELYVNHGVTSVLAQLDVSSEERRASQVSPNTPRIFHTGGRPQFSPDMDREQVKQLVREYLSHEPDVAWYPQFRDDIAEVYGWAAEEAHAAGLAIFSHTQDAGRSMEAGMDVAEHVWGFAFPLMSPQQLKDFQEGRFLHWANYLREGPALRRLIDQAVRREVYLNPTLVYEWGSLSPAARQREQEAYLLLTDPGLSYFPRELASLLLYRHRQIKGYSSRYEHLPLIAKLTSQDLETFQGAKHNVQRFIKLYVEAGGKVIAGTDAASVAVPGLSMHHEMELLVEAGLTPLQALQASSSWAADMLAGIKGARGNQRVGSIRPGNLADLVILGDDPLRDIRNTKKIEQVIKGGDFIEFGYHPDYYSFRSPMRRITMSTPVPEISAISPHRVVEGTADFRMVIEGAGFVTNSLVKLDGIGQPTTFVSPRRLEVVVPATFVERAVPDRFSSPGPDQKPGIFGDHSVAVTVWNPPPTGGLSNSISLMIGAGWRAK